MIYTFIGGSNRTADIKWGSIKGTDQLQERTNSEKFTIFNGLRPDEYDEVFMYHGVEIVTVGADYVIVKDLYEYKNIFRVGDGIWVGLNTSDEAKYTISAIDEETGKITFSIALVGISAGEFLGHRFFGGSVLKVSDYNLKTLDKIVFTVGCTDFAKLFDMNQIVDTYEDRSCRYVINDFLNTFVNYNEIIDEFDYTDNAAIQAVWVEGGVGNNPLSDSASPFEKDHWGSFASSGAGAATWVADPITAARVNAFTGVNSGMPTKGYMRFWIKHTDYTKITNYTFRIGSSNGNYIEVTKTPAQLGITTNGEIYIEIPLTDFSVTGTPDWTAVDYAYIAHTSTASTTVKIAGMRIMEEKYFKHYPFVEEGPDLETFNVNYIKPMSVMQTIAKITGYFWYIDPEMFLHFFDSTTNIAPFNIDETSDNFFDLRINVDASSLKNIQTVEGGEAVSTSTYSEAKKGDNAQREWVLKSKFAALEIWLDDLTTAHAAEAGTTATNIKITGHNLTTGDYITNRDRSNSVRQVIVVDADNLTVESVTGQIPTDTITVFDQPQASGIEGIIEDETTVDYVYNSNAMRIRASSDTSTLREEEFIVFIYKQLYPIISSVQNGASIAALINTLRWSNGEVKGHIIRNKDIKSQQEAKDRAQAEIDRYGNAIITATFRTFTYGLKAGQQIRIVDSNAGRNLDQDFMIQKVRHKVVAGKHLEYTITASSVLYGMIEFFQQLLKATHQISYDEAAIPINLIQGIETISITDAFTEKDKNTQSETVNIADNNSRCEVRTPPYKWGPDANVLEWSLGEWG